MLSACTPIPSKLFTGILRIPFCSLVYAILVHACAIV